MDDGAMGTPSPRREHLDLDRPRVLDDEREVEPEATDLPDQLDIPADVPEADAVEQELEVPIDDSER